MDSLKKSRKGKKHQGKRMNLNLAPDVRRKLDAYLAADSSDSDRTHPPKTLTEVINLALAEYLDYLNKTSLPRHFFRAH